MISKATGGANDEHIFMLSSSREAGVKVIRVRLRTNDGQATSELKGSTTDAGTRVVVANLQGRILAASFRPFPQGQ